MPIRNPSDCPHANIERGDEFTVDRCRDCYAPYYPAIPRQLAQSPAVPHSLTDGDWHADRDVELEDARDEKERAAMEAIHGNGIPGDGI